MNKAHRDWVVSFLIDQWQKGRFNADLLLKFISILFEEEGIEALGRQIDANNLCRIANTLLSFKIVEFKSQAEAKTPYDFYLTSLYYNAFANAKTPQIIYVLALSDIEPQILKRILAVYPAEHMGYYFLLNMLPNLTPEEAAVLPRIERYETILNIFYREYQYPYKQSMHDVLRDFVSIGLDNQFMLLQNVLLLIIFSICYMEILLTPDQVFANSGIFSVIVSNIHAICGIESSSIMEYFNIDKPDKNARTKIKVNNTLIAAQFYRWWFSYWVLQPALVNRLEHNSSFAAGLYYFSLFSYSVTYSLVVMPALTLAQDFSKVKNRTVFDYVEARHDLAILHAKKNFDSSQKPTDVALPNNNSARLALI